MLYNSVTGIVVQSVRAPPCQGGSCGFEPRQSRPRIRWIHQFISPFSIFCEGEGQEAEFDSKRWTLFLSFFVSHLSSDKCGNFNYFNQYHLMGERRMWIEDWAVVSPYSGFQERLYWFDFFNLLWSIEWNRVPICFPATHTQTNCIRFLL